MADGGYTPVEKLRIVQPPVEDNDADVILVRSNEEELPDLGKVRGITKATLMTQIQEDPDFNENYLHTTGDEVKDGSLKFPMDRRVEFGDVFQQSYRDDLDILSYTVVDVKIGALAVKASNAFVGVHNTNPQSILDVTGNARASENDGTPTGLVRNVDLEGLINSSEGNVFQEQLFNTASPTMVNSLTTATFNFSTSGLVISGGNGTFTNFSRLPEYSQLEDYQIETSIFRNTVQGAGLGLGIDCANGEYAICKADLSSTSGKIFISTNKSTFAYSSPTNLDYVSTDDLQIVLKRTKFAVHAYFNNLTQNKSVVATYDISATANQFVGGATINRIGRPSIWAFGGTQTFNSDGYVKYKSFANQAPTLAVAGTSIELGYGCGLIQNRWTNLDGREVFDKSILPGASSTSADIVSILPEILKLKPEYLAISCVINDAIQAIPNATTQANISTINNFCIDNDIKTIWCTSTPTTNATYNTKITANNAYILGLAGVTKFVDFYNQLLSGSVLNSIYNTGDGVHVNRLAHFVMATYFIQQTQGVLSYDNLNNFDLTQIFTNTGVSITTTGRVGIGLTDPSLPLEVAGNINVRCPAGASEEKGIAFSHTTPTNYKWQWLIKASDSRISLYNFDGNKSPLVFFNDGKASLGASSQYPTNNNVDALQVNGTISLSAASSANQAVRLDQLNAKVQNSLAASTTVAPSATAVNDALALKANLASPTFTGSVIVPTPTTSTQAANKGYVDSAISGLSIGNNNYLTTEINTGGTWTDSKPIYRIVIEHTAASVTENISISALNMETLVNSSAKLNDGSMFRVLPYSNAAAISPYGVSDFQVSALNITYDVDADSGFIYIDNRSLTTYSNGDPATNAIGLAGDMHIILEYTKTTD